MMPIYDLYSKRKKRAAQPQPEVYVYARIPDILRNQITFIIDDAIGPDNEYGWQEIADIIRREKGRSSLTGATDPRIDYIHFMTGNPATDDFLDLVEVAFCYITQVASKLRPWQIERYGVRQAPPSAVEELNGRFREAAVGYQFVEGDIVRVDSDIVHAKVVVPALQLLRDPAFSGPDEEFRSAHSHYRAGEHDDAVTDACRAFESTMKVVCDQKSWEYPAGARASDLIKILRQRGLLPNYLDNSFDQLVATLSSGLPQVRNNEGAHGQGSEPRKTPAYVAAYALHLSAANIVFLVEAAKEER